MATTMTTLGFACLLFIVGSCSGINLSSAMVPHALRVKARADDGCSSEMYLPFCTTEDYNLTIANPPKVWAKLFIAIIETGCYDHIRKFVCAALLPKCEESSFRVTFPCRRDCEIARKNCLPALQRHSGVWPTELNCDYFQDNNCLIMGPTQEMELNSKHHHHHTMKAKHGRKHRPKQRVHKKNGDTLGERVKGSEFKESKFFQMRPFLKLLKKTLDNVTGSLKVLSDSL